MNNKEYEKLIFQLKDLRDDKRKYIDWDDHDDIILQDVLALNDAIYYIQKYYHEVVNDETGNHISGDGEYEWRRKESN